ncbi:MAG: GGDEF domain-containing protein [Acholeplasmatales bacterium]|nr:GGDEF domain-containing protein [Acholeplasmatales bacterium]
MYNENDLKKYEYFFNILQQENIKYVLDSQTQLINRAHFLQLIDYLIKDNTPPFTFGLIDLDNFHFIIDNYGTYIGQEIVKEVAEGLVNFIGDNGLVGRLGGDEFMFIYFDLEEYSDIHNMLSDLYDKVLRKTIQTSSLSILVTGTTGTASYPNDATSTSELLDLANKTLYRGKMKGRNCYVIYVEEKHKNIKIEPLSSSDVFKILFNLKVRYNQKYNDFYERISSISSFIKSTMNIQILLYIDPNGKIFSSNLDNSIGVLKTKLELDDYNIFEVNTKDDLHQNQEINDLFSPFDIKAILITSISNGGYVAFANKNNKYWNPNEKAALFYLAELLSNK